MRGNVVDMAVGIVIGGAFGKIIASFVKDVLMPPIGLLMGGVDFSSLYINLGSGSYDSLALAEKAGEPVLRYGLFINTVVDFTIIAFAIFMVVNAMNKAKKKEAEKPAAEPTTKKCPECLSEIPIPAKRCAHCTSVLAAA